MTSPITDPLVVAALEKLGGGVILVDDRLHVVAATPYASRLLGARLHLGAHIASALCESTDAPLAVALAEGKPITTLVPRLADHGTIRARATPLVTKHGAGWIAVW